MIAEIFFIVFWGFEFAKLRIIPHVDKIFFLINAKAIHLVCRPHIFSSIEKIPSSFRQKSLSGNNMKYGYSPLSLHLLSTFSPYKQHYGASCMLAEWRECAVCMPAKRTRHTVCPTQNLTQSFLNSIFFVIFANRNRRPDRASFVV